MTYFLIYQRKALLDHRLMGMIVYTRHLPRYTAFAVPNLMQWVPISSLQIPRCALPMTHMASLRALITCRDVTCLMEPLEV
jgi:hypothetical protein